MFKLKLRNKSNFSILILVLIFINFSFLISNVLSHRTENISGFTTQDQIYPNESVKYIFSNNIIFEISTDSFIDLEIHYENNIENRQIFFLINNSNPISLNITSKASMQSFGMDRPPQGPKKGDAQFQLRYDCIFQINTNTTLENITISSLKRSLYGFNPSNGYSLALYEPSQESWEVISTSEQFNESSSEFSLEGSLINLQADTEYYITFFEIIEASDNWIWV